MLKSKNLVPKSRFLVANSVIFYCFFYFANFRFFHIQVYGHNEYKIRADNNRIRAIPTAAPRGLIFG
ncbi:MAG: hypothetical protein CM1200mP10_05720 [Candidatus Neomarinimicrobiota bacterium]|nr:MAG: hypothetical protein CM1200mP10_05720 [Candidatus Neomarinimicrobiota bacterium]